MTTILVIPDVQCTKDTPTRHLHQMGKYIVEKQPDVIVQIGDFADMESLSSYDVGKKQFEGRTYQADIAASLTNMRVLLNPLRDLQARQRHWKKKVYDPRLELTLGNHENRINRAIDLDRKLEGLISVDDLKYKEFGWNVHPFLEVVEIEGIAFSHYFASGAMARPASTANAQLNKQHMSCIAGHQQGLQIATGKRADGALLTSVIAGSFYLHDEHYMGVQGNKHWRGALMLHNCKDGQFDLNLLPMAYLEKKYGA